jgi:hypothetical protein
MNYQCGRLATIPWLQVKMFNAGVNDVIHIKFVFTTLINYKISYLTTK